MVLNSCAQSKRYDRIYKPNILLRLLLYEAGKRLEFFKIVDVDGFRQFHIVPLITVRESSACHFLTATRTVSKFGIEEFFTSVMACIAGLLKSPVSFVNQSLTDLRRYCNETVKFWSKQQED